MIQNTTPTAILVVEDEPLMLLAAADIVEAAGYEAVEAWNAKRAVEILETRPDIRIVFSDIDMPGCMDGVKLAAAIHDRWPPIHVILTSGYAAPSKSALPPRTLFFSKPYIEMDIVGAFRRMAP